MEISNKVSIQQPVHSLLQSLPSMRPKQQTIKLYASFDLRRWENVDVFGRPSIIAAHFECAFTVKAAVNAGSLSHAVQHLNISALYTVFDIWPAASKSRAAGKDASASLGGTTSCVTSVKST
ncbi:hypothetical protein EDC04DRAFT_2610569 [Pisolithus marmoratus]|nr:hypothetical protein EDC04DRAFT_2610569 [Pisolithus marmoratus]